MVIKTRDADEQDYGISSRGFFARTWNLFFKGRSPFWTAVFTGVLCIFTVMLVRVSKLSDETAKATQRAFISFQNIASGVKGVSDDRKTWQQQQFLLVYSNSGSTPARNAVVVATAQLLTRPMARGYNFSTEGAERANIVMGPKGSSAYPVVVPMDQVSTTRTNSNYHLYFWGSIVYRDVFPDDPPRLTEFCTEMTQVALVNKDPKPITDPKIIAAAITDPEMNITWNTVSCKEHNCYDEDCSDYSDQIKNLLPQSPSKQE